VASLCVTRYYEPSPRMYTPPGYCTGTTLLIWNILHHVFIVHVISVSWDLVTRDHGRIHEEKFLCYLILNSKRIFTPWITLWSLITKPESSFKTSHQMMKPEEAIDEATDLQAMTLSDRPGDRTNRNPKRGWYYFWPTWGPHKVLVQLYWQGAKIWHEGHQLTKIHGPSDY
jgi:hypothetical protein